MLKIFFKTLFEDIKRYLFRCEYYKKCKWYMKGMPSCDNGEGKYCGKYRKFKEQEQTDEDKRFRGVIKEIDDWANRL